MVCRMTASDEWLWVTTNNNEWQGVTMCAKEWQPVTTNDTNSDDKCQRMKKSGTTNENE